ncbi:MAG TPA: hypothetical protein VLJ84_06595, partial [Usitatibacter sp.]|nr:hypothetical protein [Usitatibacter sp.]
MPRQLWKGAIQFGLVNIPVSLYPHDNVIVLNTLRYANELRSAKDLDVPKDLKAAKVHPNEIKMAERLIADMAIKWDPSEFH